MAGCVVKFVGEVEDLDRRGNAKPRVDSVKVTEDNWLEGFTNLTLVNSTDVTRGTEAAQGDLLDFLKGRRSYDQQHSSLGPNHGINVPTRSLTL